MAITFNSLPTSKPTGGDNQRKLLDKGRYNLLIKKAEIKFNDRTNNECLRITYQYDEEHSFIFDNLLDSDKPLLQYKLQRFLNALNLTTALRNQVFELKDLEKLVTGKTLAADVTIEEAKNGYPAKNTIDCFAGDIYYPVDVNPFDGLEQNNINDDFDNCL